MTRVFKAVLLAATVMSPGAVLAQDNTEIEQVSEDPALPDNTIIVTARKRSETLQTVPTTVSVTTAETIDRLGLDSLQDIAKITPGLVFDDSFGRDGNRPVIRGQANILGASGVAYFIDGIYFTGSLADYDVDTIERIEVIKGPQSALYGRNTYSGAINIISKMPGNTWEGRVTADISEHDRYELTAGIRGPLTDSISVGLNGRYYDFGGEFTNEYDGSKIGKQSSYSVSGLVNFNNGGPFTAALRGYFNSTDDGQPALFAQGTEFNNVLFDDGALYGGGGRYFSGVVQPRAVNTDYSRQFAAEDVDKVGLESDTYNVSLRMEYELSDDLSLISLTGYNKSDGTTLLDGDYSPNSFQTAVFARFPRGAPVGFGPAGPIFPFAYVGTTVDFSFANRSESQDWSQELKLFYEGDQFDFILGGYYFDQSNDSFDIRNVPDDALARAGASFGAAFANEQAICAASPNCANVIPFFGPSVPNSRSENLRDVENIAVFGAVEWHITPDINLGIEGRYAEEKITQTLFSFNEGDPRPEPSVDGASATFKEFTPRVTFNWQLSPDNMFYAIYAEGQKPGGFNGAAAFQASEDSPTVNVKTYEAEDNTSYEIGLKNVFLDNTLQFNIAGFYTEIEGYQLTQNVSVPPNQVSVVVNAGEAEIFGIELDMIARPTDGLTFTANYALADTEFSAGFDENQGVLNDVADDRLVNCSTGDQFPDVAACQSLFGSIEGQRIPRAPVHQFFADVDYRTPIGNGDWEVFAGGNISLTSSSFAQVSNLAKSGDATLVDIRAGVQNDRYKVQFYVDNLTDEDSVAQVLRFADGNASFRRSFVAGLRPGRRLGVIVSAGF